MATSGDVDDYERSKLATEIDTKEQEKSTEVHYEVTSSHVPTEKSDESNEQEEKGRKTDSEQTDMYYHKEEFEGHTEADAVSTSGKERTSESEESDLPTDESKESPEAPSSVETEEREKESSNETTNDETSKSKTSGESDSRQDDTHALCVRVDESKKVLANRHFRHNFGFNHPPMSRPFIPQSFRLIRQIPSHENKVLVPTTVVAQDYIYCKTEVCQVKVMQEAKLMYVRDIRHKVSGYSFEDGFFARLIVQAYDYCGSMETVEYDKEKQEVYLVIQCHITGLLQVLVTDVELNRAGVLETSTVRQRKPWEISGNTKTLVLNVKHEKELHIYRGKQYTHKILYRFHDSLSHISLIPEDFFICMSDYKLTVYEWEIFQSHDFRWRLQLENPWHGYVYMSKKQMVVSTLKGRETVLQFLHMVPDKHRNFGRTVTGFLVLEFPCIPFCELSEDEIIVANIGRLDVLTKIKELF